MYVFILATLRMPAIGYAILYLGITGGINQTGLFLGYGMKLSLGEPYVFPDFDSLKFH